MKIDNSLADFIWPTRRGSKQSIYTECGRGSACFSNNNNSVDFQVKKILITQKERFYNAVFVQHF
jgi:hypothetical protein